MFSLQTEPGLKHLESSGLQSSPSEVAVVVGVEMDIQVGVEELVLSVTSIPRLLAQLKPSLSQHRLMGLRIQQPEQTGITHRLVLTSPHTAA